MDCPQPRCSGTLSREQRRGICTSCHLPARACQACDSWNRRQATFCRTCGVLLEELARAVPAAATLAREPTHTPLESGLRTPPQQAYGLLWMLFENGILASFNPHSPSAIERLQQVAPLWQGARSHAFTVRELRRSADAQLSERFALIASESSLDARGLVSGRELNFSSWLPGETVLCDARDAYQMIEGTGDRLYCLTVREGRVSLLQVNPFTGDAGRTEIDAGNEPVCGPVLWQKTVLVWTKTSVWTLEDGKLTRHAMPAGVALWTSPNDADRVRLPMAAVPAMLQADGLYLPGTRYGGAVLLALKNLHGSWRIGVVPIPREGVLTADAASEPLLVTDGHLLSCAGQSFRELESNEALSGQFTAYADASLRVFFCQSDSGGRQHVWLRAWTAESELPVTWRLQSGRSLKECAAFWSVDGSLSAQIFTDGQTSAQELLAWSA